MLHHRPELRDIKQSIFPLRREQCHRCASTIVLLRWRRLYEGLDMPLHSRWRHEWDWLLHGRMHGLIVEGSSVSEAVHFEYGADIVYDATSGHWDCCRSTEDSLNCQEPSDMAIDAPSPSDLVVIKQLTQAVPSTALTTGIGMISSVESVISETTSTSSASTSASISASITSASTATTTARTVSESGSPSFTPVSHANGGLSAGAEAGIAVGVIIAATLAALSAVLFWRKNKGRRRKLSEAAHGETNADQKHPFVMHSSSEAYPYYGPMGESGYGPSELPMNPSSQTATADAKLGREVEMYGLRPQELDTERTRQELPGHPSEK
ncbi:hypothetical protein EJ03DRAFT_75203 [Teratosphaeria nubilosa]|uniref:Uncharacterized protein n=1 Tax=Teratosphaeria nubilosa TaxID=161662 RepID=A0A6G1LMD9_9PEZI|nr:hypothetical protein EJ03DRAFT_75203 [Teratosphaeria nubilosa]